MEGFPADRPADYLSTPPLAALPATAAPPAATPPVPAQAPAAELAPDTLTWTLPADRPPPVRPARAPWWSFPRARRYLTRFSQAGLTGALIFYCLSLTPSLLPRVWYLQAAMSGVTVIIGYAVGLFIGWLLRSLIPWRGGPRARRAAGWTLAIAAIVLVPLCGVLGAEWQHDIREAVDAPQPSEARYVLVVLAALLIAFALLMLGRGIRWLVRLVARLLGRFIPARVATALAVIVVCAVLGLLVTGVVSRLAFGAANSVFSGVDSGTAAGVTQPTAPQRSGSPDSLVAWSTLGRQGRTFVAGGPTVAQISAFTGTTAMEPIRVYAGLKSADSIAAESTLVVRELERTGAFNRKVIVVATTTGAGWLNPEMIDPLEYMYGGDTAVAAIQYSYLPGWISFLVDKAPAQEAGRDLFDDVYAKWRQLPAGHRPLLVVFGESLGSFGGEAAFSGTDDIVDRTSGVLWVGPTNSNTLWSRFTAGRDPGTPQWRPVYAGGHTVRFGSTPAELAANTASWHAPRVVYLQNASDPILWWSWQLAFHQPGLAARPPRSRRVERHALVPAGDVLAGLRRPGAGHGGPRWPRPHLRHAAGRGRLGEHHSSARLDAGAHRSARRLSPT